MKIKKGNYKKIDGTSREVKLYVLLEKENTIEGIDLNKLTEQEQKDFIEFIIEYEVNLQNFIKKAYRTFKKDGFENIKEEYLKNEEQ